MSSAALWLSLCWIGDWAVEESASGAGLSLDAALGVPEGVDEPRLSRYPLGCLLVIPPRSLAMASTSWMPSAGLGFFSLMYRSRCLPSDDEVKAWPQNWHFLSLGALVVLEGSALLSADSAIFKGAFAPGRGLWEGGSVRARGLPATDDAIERG